MNPDDITKHLWPEEKALLSGCRLILEQDTQPLPESAEGVMASLMIDALERLAKCRQLMKKHQFVSLGMGIHQCRECKQVPFYYDKSKLPPKCKPPCLWAQAIEKGE